MLFMGFKTWLKKEKMNYAILKNKRVLRLYRLYKLKAPDIIIKNELKLIRQSFLDYLFKKYIYKFIRNTIYFFIIVIFPSFLYNWVMWMDYELNQFIKNI